MQILRDYTQFTPAGDPVTVSTPALGGRYALPVVDPNAPALAITNAGPAHARLNFGDANVPAHSHSTGLFDAPAGVTVLVVGTHAEVAAAASHVAVASAPGGARLTFRRGAVATLLLAG